MTPATVNAYFNPPANEVGFASTWGFLSIYRSLLDRVPCRHSASAILQQRLARLPHLRGVRSSCFPRADCVSFALLVDNMLISFNT